MTGKILNRFYCDFCKRQDLGLNYKNLESSNLVICQPCINSLTIADFIQKLKYHPQEIQTLTLKEITNDNRMDYTTTNRKIG